MTGKGGNPTDDVARREVYVQHRLAGVMPTQSARLAGYKNPRESCRDLEKMPEITKIIEDGNQALRQEAKWTRNKVLETIEDAIDLAKIISDPSAMIRGAGEVNKMQGYYAPETKEIKITGAQAQQREAISHMSEADLLEHLGKDRAYIDAEFEVIPNDQCAIEVVVDGAD